MREQALAQENQALQCELRQLREAHARLLALRQGVPEEPGADLPTSLHALDGSGSRRTAQSEFEALFAALSSAFPIGVYRTDTAGLVTHVDDGLQRIFELELPGFADHAWLARVHPDDVVRVRGEWMNPQAGQTSHSAEFRLLCPLRGTVHVLARNMPLRDAKDQVIGQIGFVQDISSLRQLEADARIKDELNRQIIASSPDCTLVLDLQGRVVQMTEQGCLLFDVDAPEQVIGSAWAQWWPDLGAREAHGAIERARSGERARFIASCPTFKGRAKWWDTMLSAICDADGQPAMLLAVSRDITEQQLRQEEISVLNTQLELRVQQRTEELAEINERLRNTLSDANALYHQAPCGYHSLNLDGVYVSINDTELQWLGYQREEVVGTMRFSDFIPPGLVPMLEERLGRLVRDGALEGAEYTMKRRDGTVFHALLSSSAVRDAQGRFLHSNTTVVDISARKEAERALEESQRFLQTITDHMPGLIAFVDADSRLRFCNAEYQHIFGLDMQQSQGRRLPDCVPASEWADLEPGLKAALAGQTLTLEGLRQTAHGRQIVVRTTLQPDWHDGRVQGVFLQAIDITEHKQIEQRVSQLNDELEQRIQHRSQELLESEQRFRLMVDNLRDYCIFFLDASGRISDWTDSAQRLEGYAPTEIVGEHYDYLFRGEDPNTARQSADSMLRLAASRGQHELSGWHTRKDGSTYFAHSLLIALRDENGDLQGFAKINRDMTDAKRLDDLLRNINDELENRVAERTEQLLAANKDLESFSYSVSHDLRSPLRHISSFVSLLEEHLGQRNDDVTQRYLSTISHSARHMSQLIDGLLAFSRLGRAAVNFIEVDFLQLVEAVVSQLSHDVGERKVEWIIPEDLPVVQGDALLLREVWANLLGNAFKYSRPRKVSRIEIRWSADPAVGYIFEVRDNGVGFDTKYAQKLFGVFQRLHRASEFEGTGIGLALTRRILERHGGSIWADSRQGEGSVFSFSLPFEGHSPSESQLDTSPSVLEP